MKLNKNDVEMCQLYVQLHPKPINHSQMLGTDNAVINFYNSKLETKYFWETMAYQRMLSILYQIVLKKQSSQELVDKCIILIKKIIV